MSDSGMKFWRMGGITLLLAMLCAIATPLSASTAASDSDQQVPFRLLVSLLQLFPLPGDTVELRLGPEMPTDLPFEVPVPESGTLQWSLATLPNHHSLVFEVNGDPAQLNVTYPEQLQASGWKHWSVIRARHDTSNSAFVTSVPFGDGPATETPIFCQQGNDVELYWHVTEDTADTTLLRVELRTDDSSSFCNPGRAITSERFPSLNLPLPENAQLLGARGGGNADASDRRTGIQTTLSLEELAAHYTNTMYEQGWTLEHADGDQLLQWSVWSRGAEPAYRVTLYLLATEDSEHYLSISKGRRNYGSEDLSNLLATNAQLGTVPKETALTILGADHNDNVNLWVDQPPPVLAAELQIPPETSVLGGISRTDVSGVAVLETSLTNQQLYNFYRETLTGWENPRTSSIDIVFGESGFTTPLSGVFCSPDKTRELVLWPSQPSRDGLNTVRISYQPSHEFSSCQRVPATADSTPIHSLADSPLPVLAAPLGSSVAFKGGGFGPALYYTDAYIISEQASDDVIDHYTEQMRQFGWVQQTRSRFGDSLVSLWTFETETGNTWRGLFSLIQAHPGEWLGYFYGTQSPVSLCADNPLACDL